jgi:PHD/YefM family antitoxin component YafN of YafNO toxin-antitoxin module
MAVMIGGERVVRLTDLRRSAKTLVDQLKAAKTQQESRVVLTTHGKPVAVLQEYHAYQKMLEILEESQRNLQIAEARERLREMNADTMGTISLDQVIEQKAPTLAAHHDSDNV